MEDETTKKTIADILKRLEAVEQKQQNPEPPGLQSPTEAEQEKFQSTLEAFNRDKKGQSLNSAMTPEQTAEMLRKLDDQKEKDDA